MNNPPKAEEIEILGLDFSKMPDNVVKEKLFAFETMALAKYCIPT